MDEISRKREHVHTWRAMAFTRSLISEVT
jgi:hypothetical protein